MSWRIVVQELYARGPLSFRQFRLPAPGYGIRQGLALGLMNGPGRNCAHGTYTLTEAGVAAAQNRLQFACAPRPAGISGRVPGPNRLVPTWLASLPAANAVRVGPGVGINTQGERHA